MKALKRITALLMIMVFVLSLAGCSSKEEGKKKITIAYQTGICYAPIHVMEAQKLVEKYYDGEIEVVYQQIGNGAAINEAFIGGTIQMGVIGPAPAIQGVLAGIPYKCIANISSQGCGLMSNDPSITSLKDIGPEDKIALLNTGSIYHIMLAAAAEKYLGDAHALDNNIAPMPHADGMGALESGTVKLHLTQPPYINQERDKGTYTELSELTDVWPADSSFVVAMASTELEKDEKLFTAIQKALADAFEFINTDVEGTADIEVQYLGLDRETVMYNLTDPNCSYKPELKGVKECIDFMYRAGFTEKELAFEDFKFDCCKGN